MRNVTLLSAASIVLVVATASPAQQPTRSETPARQSSASHAVEVESFRATYEKSLLADDGYLTLCGLFFLEEGENSLGSDPGSRIRLGADVVPARAGSVFVENGTYRFALRDGLKARLGEQELASSPMRISIPEIGQRADRFALGRITFWIHMSGDRPTIRVRDPECHVRKAYSGLKWFDVDAKWTSPATMTPYAEPRTLEVINIRGDHARVRSPGVLRVTVERREFEMVPVVEGTSLVLYFTDTTAGVETYKAVRFVNAEPQPDGTYVVDFNKAYNPPCAYSEYTTCPLPPRENRLPMAVRAGERIYKPS